MKATRRIKQGWQWLMVEGLPRLGAVWRRAWAEDDHFQLLTHVTEARTCIEAAERPEGALVEVWSPEEYREQALVELKRAEAILRRIGRY